MGGGTAGFFGSGGVLAGGLDVFGSLTSADTYTDPFALIGTAIKAKNVYENAKNLTKEGVRKEITNIAEKSLTKSAQQTLDQKGEAKFDAYKTTKAQALSPNTTQGVIPAATVNANNQNTTVKRVP